MTQQPKLESRTNDKMKSNLLTKPPLKMAAGIKDMSTICPAQNLPEQSI